MLLNHFLLYLIINLIYRFLIAVFIIIIFFWIFFFISFTLIVYVLNVIIVILFLQDVAIIFKHLLKRYLVFVIHVKNNLFFNFHIELFKLLNQIGHTDLTKLKFIFLAGIFIFCLLNEWLNIIEYIYSFIFHLKHQHIRLYFIFIKLKHIFVLIFLYIALFQIADTF